ncbi:hypothetical protein ACJJTC_012895 [Scirpophaga incertulas]
MFVAELGVWRGRATQGEAGARRRCASRPRIDRPDMQCLPLSAPCIHITTVTERTNYCYKLLEEITALGSNRKGLYRSSLCRSPYLESARANITLKTIAFYSTTIAA